MWYWLRLFHLVRSWLRVLKDTYVDRAAMISVTTSTSSEPTRTCSDVISKYFILPDGYPHTPTTWLVQVSFSGRSTNVCIFGTLINTRHSSTNAVCRGLCAKFAVGKHRLNQFVGFWCVQYSNLMGCWRRLDGFPYFNICRICISKHQDMTHICLLCHTIFGGS